jgi:prolyl-tRNA synthetase
VIRKIEAIVREEHEKANAQEILMPFVQPAEVWRESGRWEKYEQKDKIMLRFKDRHENDYCLQPTSEDVVTALFRDNVQSYRDLPQNWFHIQTKFRDEIRPRFGLMRTREFIMKDAYTFDLTKEDALKSYDVMKQTYINIFTRIGVDFRPVSADNGDMGGDYSHEFQVLAQTGEDELLFDPDSDYAVNVEKYDPATAPKPKEELEQVRGIEVGHIFYLGTTYTQEDAMDVKLQHADGESRPVHMGCYGIGVSRVAAAAIEQNHDENGIIWPEAIAPYTVGIICMRPDDAECLSVAEKVYADLQARGIDVLLDDSKEPAGAKFARMDLIGLPWQCVVGPKGIKAGELEWKYRKTGERQNLPLDKTPL